MIKLINYLWNQYRLWTAKYPTHPRYNSQTILNQYLRTISGKKDKWHKIQKNTKPLKYRKLLITQIYIWYPVSYLVHPCKTVIDFYLKSSHFTKRVWRDTYPNNRRPGLNNSKQLFKYALYLFQNNSIMALQPPILHVSLISPMRATCPTYLNVLHRSPCNILVTGLWRPSFCNFIRPPVTSSVTSFLSTAQLQRRYTNSSSSRCLGRCEEAET